MPGLTHWTAEQVRRIGPNICRAPVIGARDVVPVAPGLAIWDAWPVQMRDGWPMRLEGGDELWMALGAPRADDPDERHAIARIHLLKRGLTEWHHLGTAMPDGFSPGSREWSGSAIFDPATARVTLYFTAAGRRGETTPTSEQRMFSATAALTPDGRCTDWRALAEIVTPDPAHYMATGGGGEIGTIKAFRDPSYFRDPATGRQYLYFAGSLAGSSSAYNGVVGLAVAAPDAPGAWRLMPPVIAADGLNNELERPHVVAHSGRYYLLWSTQRHVFDPTGPAGPTGLYGMVSDNPESGWRPLNGSGLVFANPDSAPAQAYSWMVLPDLSVTSFVDDWGDGGTRRFGGSFAPFLDLMLEDDRAMLKTVYHAA